MSDLYAQALRKHSEWKGKLRVISHAPIDDRSQLALAYTPGVAAACLAIQDDPQRMDDLTWVNSTVAIISDGSAVLGLGNIGPKAGMPVMEGKAALFVRFGGLNAIPICLDTQDPEEIIQICKAMAPSFGGINLEDISAPRCVTIERRLKEELDIPVFHDDQHGTAIVVLAGLINSLRLTGKNKEDMTITVSGTGVSAPGLVTKEMAKSMKQDAVLFAMANPEPEIAYDLAKEAGVRIVGTGRSDRPNQINNVLVFPGLFKGALSAKAKQITEPMKIAAAIGLASLISDEELDAEHIIPDVFDPRVADTVAKAVMDEVRKGGEGR